jgi:hypothetical protein
VAGVSGSTVVLASEALEARSELFEAKLELSLEDVRLVHDSNESSGAGAGVSEAKNELPKLMMVVSATGVDVSGTRAKPLDKTAGVSEAKEETHIADTVGVSFVNDTLYEVMVVEFSTGISITEGSGFVVVAIVGKLLVTSGAVIVVELMSELEDDARHLPLTSTSVSLGTSAFCPGRVRVHSFSSFMFWTPRRESLR